MRCARAPTLVVGVLVLASCAGASSRLVEASPPFPIERADMALKALCDLEAIGSPSDRAAATFFGRVHLSLHELAAAIQPLDRELTARLLEAKAAVEGPLESGASPDRFPLAVRSLLGAAVDALVVLGVEVEAPCPT